jgi:hypothetical protein
VFGESLDGKWASAWHVQEEGKLGKAATELSKVETMHLLHVTAKNICNVSDMNAGSDVKMDL